MRHYNIWKEANDRNNSCHLIFYRVHRSVGCRPTGWQNSWIYISFLVDSKCIININIRTKKCNETTLERKVCVCVWEREDRAHSLKLHRAWTISHNRLLQFRNILLTAACDIPQSRQYHFVTAHTLFYVRTISICLALVISMAQA